MTDSDSTPESINIESNEDVTCVATNTLQIGAILVHKTAKHADSETGDDPADGCRVQRAPTTAKTTDVDITTGADGYGCADGFLGARAVVGDYTVTEAVPAGYAAEDGVQDYTVVVGDCDMHLGRSRRPSS